MSKKITETLFGYYKGLPVKKFTIFSEKNIALSVMNYGATITNLFVPDKSGAAENIILGFDSLEEYMQTGNAYIGCICGRYANRIANAKFPIYGKDYNLIPNAGAHSLHGGETGFDKVYWNAKILPGEKGIQFTYRSIDGEEGFPGNLDVEVIYSLENNSVRIEYSATTDQATPVNLTSHCYFNLSGGKENTILNHELLINADKFLEVDDALIPTGEFLNVKNSGMDFTSLQPLSSLLQSTDGFDNSWVLNKKNGYNTIAAKLVHKESGRQMHVQTTEPGIHFYSGNLLEDTTGTNNGMQYGNYAGLCLEAQRFPDSPNKSLFPNTILRPGIIYKQLTQYSFPHLNDN